MILQSADVIGQTENADVCIIGAGAAGIVMAVHFARLGRSVLLCEGGGEDYEDESQELYVGETSGPLPINIDTSRLRYLGGSSNHWAGQVGPFDPIDFRARPWVPHSGWPVDEGALAPYYDAAHVECDTDGSTRFIPSEEETRQYALLEGEGPGIVNKLRRRSPPTRWAEKHRADLETDPNIRVILNATAVRIDLVENGDSVDSLAMKDTASGGDFTVKAKQYVICTGGIENARLLLQPSTYAPSGVGNTRDVVGRYFMFHPRTSDAAAVVAPQVVEKLQYYQEFESADGILQFFWSLSDAAQEDHGLLNFGFLPRATTLENLEGEFDTRDVQAVADLMDVSAGGGTEPSFFTLRYLVEQAPNPSSRVTLTDTRDRLGVIQPRVDWRMTDLDKESYQRTTRLMAEAVMLGGLGRLGVPTFYDGPDWTDATFESYHHMGGTRMGTDPAFSVVDPDCYVHGIDNLGIAGSSVFPTSGWINPTYTIVALALRLVEKMDTRLG